MNEEIKETEQTGQLSDHELDSVTGAGAIKPPPPPPPPPCRCVDMPGKSW